MASEAWFAKLQELNVRRSAKTLEMPVLFKTETSGDVVVRDELVSVVEVYLKSNYLKSFGYKKISLPTDFA